MAFFTTLDFVDRYNEIFRPPYPMTATMAGRLLRALAPEFGLQKRIYRGAMSWFGRMLIEPEPPVVPIEPRSLD